MKSAERGREKGERRRRVERSELHRYRKRLGQNGGGEEIEARGPSEGRDRVNNNCRERWAFRAIRFE